MNLDDSAREALAGLADILIPAGEDMPSASQADVAGSGLDMVLAARPDLADALNDILDKSRDREPAEVVADLQANHETAFGVLTEIVPGAYFMNAVVRQAIGYAGQGPQPIDPRPDYMEDGLLESVIRRGPVYRPTPNRAES